MRRECRQRFPRHRLQRKRLVSDPCMHPGMCVTHVSWCTSGSLSRGSAGNAPGIPGACATPNVTYMVRGPLQVHNPLVDNVRRHIAYFLVVTMVAARLISNSTHSLIFEELPTYLSVLCQFPPGYGERGNTLTIFVLLEKLTWQTWARKIMHAGNPVTDQVMLSASRVITWFLRNVYDNAWNGWCVPIRGIVRGQFS